MRDQFSTIDGLPAVIREQMVGICETFSGTLGDLSGTDDELSGALTKSPTILLRQTAGLGMP